MLNSKYNILKPSSFKKLIGGSFKIVYNQDSEKHFVVDEFNNFYYCQEDIDTSLPMAFLIEKQRDIEDACLINVPS